ncbi:MAG TPA: hypothetical protein VMT90_10020, partial [Dehalococcoidia bacterium]|nr:hypothetical protein [Dehalococcoidia bacterium]
DNTATRRSSYYSVLSASVSATYTDYKAFLSEIVVVRSTITDFYHYALSDASLALGGALTTVYGYYSPALVQGANKRPFWDAGIAGNKNDTSGNRFRSNTAFGTVATAGLFGNGDGVVHIHAAATNPAANPTAGVILYVDAATGNLIARGAAGTLTVLAVP